MADPKRSTLKLVEIETDYEAPANAKPEELQKAAYAKAMREGAKRAGIAHAAMIEGLKLAQTEELARVSHRERAVGHHRAAWIFGLMGALISGVCVFFVIDAGQKAAFDAANQAASQATTNGYMLRSVDDGRNPREQRDAP